MSLHPRVQAWGALWARYGSAFRHAWRHRRTLVTPNFVAQEAEFLPAALSLQAQPVSPTGRWVARVLMLLIVVLLVWSIFGNIDIVVNAQGKIVPTGRTKSIASVETASVRAIHVREGQSVAAGDPLIELDTREIDSEHDKAMGDAQLARLQAARARAMLEAIDRNKTPNMPAVEQIPEDHLHEARLYLLDQWRDYTAKIARIDGDIRRYSQSLPLAAQRAKDFADLAANHDVSVHSYLEKEQARVDLEGQLVGARRQKDALVAETRRVAQDSLNEATKIIGVASQDARRAGVRSELLKLVAPVDGTVQQLSVHTIGGVVPSAQPLMQIVPKQNVIEIEAFVANRDIGFVREGQEVQVKIDAFEYTKYGTVPAIVKHVSRDSIEDEKKGLIYSVKVELGRNTVAIDGKSVSLTPGMSATVDIKTGTRRVIEYVLSPLIQHGRESMHER